MPKEAETALNEKDAGPTQAPRDLRLPAALVRTALSSEQTLMSWVRTSLSLFISIPRGRRQATPYRKC